MEHNSLCTHLIPSLHASGDRGRKWWQWTLRHALNGSLRSTSSDFRRVQMGQGVFTQSSAKPPEVLNLCWASSVWLQSHLAGGLTGAPTNTLDAQQLTLLRARARTAASACFGQLTFPRPGLRAQFPRAASVRGLTRTPRRTGPRPRRGACDESAGRNRAGRRGTRPVAFWLTCCVQVHHTNPLCPALTFTPPPSNLSHFVDVTSGPRCPLVVNGLAAHDNERPWGRPADSEFAQLHASASLESRRPAVHVAVWRIRHTLRER